MAYVVRADVIDEGLEVISTHEFWGATPQEANAGFNDFLAASKAMQQAEDAGLLEVSEVEEISDDELPEVTEEDDEEEDDEDDGEGAEILGAEIIREK